MRHTTRRPARGDAVGPLDRRMLLAATAAIESGTLVVTGTSAGETIRVAYNPATNALDVIADGSVIASPSTLDVFTIVVNAGAGDDRVTIDTKKTAVIVADDGNDSVFTSRGSDTIYGGAGNDSIESGNGNDSVLAGEGDDTIRAGGGTDYVKGDAGDDSLDGGSGNDGLYADAGDDTLLGQGGGDFLSGGSGINVLDGGSGSDAADLGLEDDSRPAGEYNHNYTSTPLRASLDGIANDGFLGSATGNVLRCEVVSGGAGDDSLVGSGKADFIDGRGGNDTLRGLGGDDSLTGDAGDDQLDGGTGADTLLGQRGSDLVIGGPGPDVLNTENLDDGADTLLGGSGDDMFELGFKPQTVAGGAGDDTIAFVTYSSDALGLASDISGNGGTDTFGALAAVGAGSNGSANSDITLDDQANDTLYGAAGNNVRADIEVFNLSNYWDRFDASMVTHRVEVNGNAGFDTLIGGSGSDKLRGGDGNDSVVGNGGTDFINGGAGQDFIDSADGVFDLVNGSSGGSDVARRDAGLDDASNVESLLT
ncbi:MAG: calcium-binding protein [Tepidisphaeraceae bacterium]